MASDKPDQAALRAIAEEGLRRADEYRQKRTDFYEAQAVADRFTAHAGTHYAALCRAVIDLLNERELTIEEIEHALSGEEMGREITELEASFDGPPTNGGEG